VSDRLTFTQGDIRDLKEGDLYDVVTSLFHVFSYQKSDNDVFCALNSVSRNLTSGGLFLSDCWYGPGVLSQKPGLRVLHLASPEFDVTRIAEPVLDDINNLVDIKYTIFVQEKNTALIQKFEEVHTMRYFFSSEVKRFWSESGFENVCIGKWFDLDKSLDMGDWAALILAQKK
jgi:SAM-dependent methyltransferase